MPRPSKIVPHLVYESVQEKPCLHTRSTPRPRRAPYYSVFPHESWSGTLLDPPAPATPSHAERKNGRARRVDLDTQGVPRRTPETCRYADARATSSGAVNFRVDDPRVENTKEGGMFVRVMVAEPRLGATTTSTKKPSWMECCDGTVQVHRDETLLGGVEIERKLLPPPVASPGNAPHARATSAHLAARPGNPGEAKGSSHRLVRLAQGRRERYWDLHQGRPHRQGLEPSWPKPPP